MASWAGSHLGPSRSYFCSFPNADQEGCGVGGGGWTMPREVCVCMWAGAIFQSWLLTANDPMLAVPREPQF